MSGFRITGKKGFHGDVPLEDVLIQSAEVV